MTRKWEAALARGRPQVIRNGRTLIKSPKVYVADSDLACHLLGIDSASELAKSPFLGALFEGAEMVKAQTSQGGRPEIYYFRDEQGLKVDFLVPGRNGLVALVECKPTRTVTPGMAVSMQRLPTALTRKHPRGSAVEMFLVHQSPKSPAATETLAPGIRAPAWPDFVSQL